MSLRLCNCCHFDDVADPFTAAPCEHNALLHYVTHGPVQPATGFAQNADDQCFRPEWYAHVTQYSWLEYSMTKHTAFCYFCHLFALENASTVASGQVDTAFTVNGFSNWKKALKKDHGFRKHSESKRHLFAEKAYCSFLQEKPIERVRRLAKTCELDEPATVSQWRLLHHLVPATASMHEAYRLLPQSYTELRHLYIVLLTLLVTTALVERGF